MSKRILSFITAFMVISTVLLSDNILPYAHASAVSAGTYGTASQSVGDPLYSNDPLLKEQWNLELTGASSAWDNSFTGQGVRVAVIDTGINPSHEDFAGTDIERGYNYVANNTDTGDSDGHGTFVSGIIAAQTNNGVGISGLTDDVTIVPLKVFDGYEGNTEAIIRAIYDAVDVYKCDVINMSLGISENFPPIYPAVLYAYRKGVIIVASAGNDGSAMNNYPASYPEVAGVGSVDYDPASGVKVSSFSQKSGVFVTAPGSDIISLDNDSNDYYNEGAGTSFAAPHVAAMAIMAKQADKGMTVEHFKTLLQNSSTDMGIAGYDQKYGYGFISISKFIDLLKEEYPDADAGAQTGTPEQWVNIFKDVSDTDWFYNSVSFVNRNQLFHGTSEDMFSPGANMTRGMFVTVLGRLYEAGGSELGTTAKICRFSDAEVGSWYYDYMNWAAENGIVQGYSPDKFAPYAPVTREQIAVFLYRYAKAVGYDMTYKETNALSYMADGGDTSEWADAAMSWAISTSLIRGRRGEIVDPQGIATRSEVAQIFMRFEDLFGNQ